MLGGASNIHEMGREMLMHVSGRIAAGLLVLLLAACAEDAARPVPVQPIATAQKSTLHLSDVSAEAQQGVVMTPTDLQRIAEQVQAEIAAHYPGIMVAHGGASEGSTKLKIVFTRYDEGSSFGRFMLAGVGQIYIDADVVLIDGASGQVLGKYQVSKQFAFGGWYGAFTRIQDVEKGFAKSVAEIFKDKI